MVLGQTQVKNSIVKLKKVATHVDDSGSNTLAKYAYPHYIRKDDMQMYEMNPVARAFSYHMKDITN